MFKKYTQYIESLRAHPDSRWFRAKTFGWGWMPVRWQGWLTVLLFVAFVCWDSLRFNSSLPLGDCAQWQAVHLGAPMTSLQKIVSKKPKNLLVSPPHYSTFLTLSYQFSGRRTMKASPDYMQCANVISHCYHLYFSR